MKGTDLLGLGHHTHPNLDLGLGHHTDPNLDPLKLSQDCNLGTPRIFADRPGKSGSSKTDCEMRIATIVLLCQISRPLI